LCSSAKAPTDRVCLTPTQVEAARKIYAPVTNPRTKQQIYPGLAPGGELLWARKAGPQPFPVSVTAVQISG
jgi:hypothetical protein